MILYIISDTPEILSLGIRAMLISMNRRANIILQSSYQKSIKGSKSNISIYFLLLTSDKNSLMEIKKYTSSDPTFNKFIIITQNNDFKYVPPLKNIDFDALVSAEVINLGIMNEIFHNIENDKMYIHSFNISEILKYKYDNYNKHLKTLTTREFEILNNILMDKNN
jgi:DNA-binding NarL/FixJ family response regulator